MKKFIYISSAAVVCLFYATYTFTQQQFAVKAKPLNSTNSSLCKIDMEPEKKVSPPTKKNRVALLQMPAEEYFQMDEVAIESGYSPIIDCDKCFRYFTCGYNQCYAYLENTVVADTLANAKVEVADVERKPELNLKLYPNPMQYESRLEIENYGDEIYSVELYDISGKLIRQESNLSGNVYIFQRNDLPTGIYIWRFVTEKNLLRSGRLIVS